MSVTSGFHRVWFVCLERSVQTESRTRCYCILLVSTEWGFPGSRDGGQGVRNLIFSVVVKAGAGLAHTPTDPN